jgi:hypothetical protein
MYLFPALRSRDLSAIADVKGFLKRLSVQPAGMSASYFLEHLLSKELCIMLEVEGCTPSIRQMQQSPP